MSDQAAQPAGFEIKDRFYAWPESFRMGDVVLVEQVTGLDWPAFTNRLPDEEEIAGVPDEAEDLVVLTGLMATSIWQNHPHWRRDRVIRYVEQLDLESIKFLGGDVPDEAEPDARPPDQAGETSSGTPPTPLSEEPESPSDVTPPSTGADG